MRRLLVTAFLLLSGCASSPMAPESLDAEAKQFATPPPGKANIYVYRESFFFGAAVPFQAVLDGRIAGSLAANTYLLVSVPVGQHALMVTAYENSQLERITAETGRRYFFKAVAVPGLVSPRVALEPVNEQEGRRGVLGTKRGESVTYE